MTVKMTCEPLVYRARSNFEREEKILKREVRFLSDFSIAGIHQGLAPDTPNFGYIERFKERDTELLNGS